MLAHTIDTIDMLDTNDDQLATHQHVDIPIANASDIGTIEGLPSETGIIASGTGIASSEAGPIDAPMQTTQQQGDISPDVIGDDARRSAAEQRTSPSSSPSASSPSAQAMPRNLAVAVAMALLAIVGIVAGQVIGSINGRTKTTFDDVARQLGASTSPANEQNAPVTSLAESTSAASNQDLINAGATLLKEIQQMRERWVERKEGTIGTLEAHRETFGIVLTEAQSDLLQEYIHKFERLDAEGMAQFAAMENDLLKLTVFRIRLERLKQLDQEWKDMGKEFARRGREVGLK